jgi:hypothetical protein
MWALDHSPGLATDAPVTAAFGDLPPPGTPGAVRLVSGDAELVLQVSDA